MDLSLPIGRAASPSTPTGQREREFEDLFSPPSPSVATSIHHQDPHPESSRPLGPPNPTPPPPPPSNSASNVDETITKKRRSKPISHLPEKIEARNDQVEFNQILKQKADLRLASQLNANQQDKTISLLAGIKYAYDHLDEFQRRLEYADKIEAEDSPFGLMPIIERESYHLPRFPRLVDSIPLLRLHADENLEFRQLATVTMWIAADVKNLKKAVLAECKRIFLRQALNDSLIKEPSQMVDSMSVMELTLASLPLNIKEMQASSQMQDSFHGASEDQNPDEEDEENQVNWKKVADSVGTHSSEDCRTRWLMHDRPGLNSDEWSHEEQDRLKEIVGGLWEVKNGEDGEDRDQSKGKGKSKAKGKAIVKGMRKGKGKEREVEVDMEVETENGEGKEKEENELEIGDEIDWEEIARLLNTGRNGAQCMAAFTRSSLSQFKSVPFTEKEDQELLRLIKIVGPRWNTIGDRLGTNREAFKCHQRYVTGLDSSIYRGQWFSHEDKHLISALKVFGADVSDWKSVAFYVPGRTPQQCRERWKGRLSVVTDLTKDDDELSTVKGKGKGKKVDLEVGPTDPTRRGDAVGRRWTEAEDDRLRACAGKEGMSWVEVGEHVGGMTDKQARDRFMKLQARDLRQASASDPSSSSAAASTSKTSLKRKAPASKGRGKKKLPTPDLDDDLVYRDSEEEELQPSTSTSRKKPLTKFQLDQLLPPTSPTNSIQYSPEPEEGEESTLKCPEFNSNGLPCDKVYKRFKTLKGHLMNAHGREVEEPKLMRKFETGEKQKRKREEKKKKVSGSSETKKASEVEVEGHNGMEPDEGEKELEDGEIEDEEEETTRGKKQKVDPIAPPQRRSARTSRAATASQSQSSAQRGERGRGRK